VKQVLLHEDAGVFKFLLHAIAVNVRPFGWLVLRLLALRDLKQEILKQVDIVGLRHMLENIECVLH
jgi:hypothetical protein